MTDGNGIPIAIVIDGANRHDMKLLETTLEAQRIVPDECPSDEQRHLCLDKGYDYAAIREIVKAWGYGGHIPPRNESERMIDDIPNYRARRWVVERTALKEGFPP